MIRKVVFPVFLIVIFIVFSHASKSLLDNVSFEASNVMSPNTGEIYRNYIKCDLSFVHFSGNSVINALVRIEEDSLQVENKQRAYIREGYIMHDILFDKTFQSLTLSFGKMIHVWGNADDFKPLDILNPQDYSFLLFKPLEERKYGVMSLKFQLHMKDNLFVELIGIPDNTVSNIDSEVFKLQGIEDIEDNPDYTLNTTPYFQEEKMGVGFRLGYMLNDIDMHLNYYMGHDNFPVYKASIAGVGLPYLDFTPSYYTLEMLGFDFQRAFGNNMSIRGECAYFTQGKYFEYDNTEGLISPFFQDILNGGDGLVQKKYIDYTIGFDWNNIARTKLYANIQVNRNSVIDYSDNLKRDENTDLLLGVLTYSFMREKLKLELKEFYSIDDKASCLRMNIGYRISENYKLNLGIWNIDGNKTTYWGQFSDKDMIYCTAEYFF